MLRSSKALSEERGDLMRLSHGARHVRPATSLGQLSRCGGRSSGAGVCFRVGRFTWLAIGW
eukprot:7242332-Prorocentrum_lima.AAC.1